MCASAAATCYAAVCVLLRPLICNLLMLLEERIFFNIQLCWDLEQMQEFMVRVFLYASAGVMKEIKKDDSNVATSVNYGGASFFELV